MTFQGKSILITGGSKGIGKAIAREFAGRGANVFLVARGLPALESARDEIARDFPAVRVGIVQADVANREQSVAAVEAMRQEFGGIDGIVNNAGAAVPKYFEESLPEEFEDTIRTGYLGSVYCTHAAYPQMKSGSFVAFTSSVAGFLGAFGYTSYCPAKFAQMGFAEALYYEAALKGIQVSVLCPPDTATPGFDEENKTKPFETAELGKTAKLMQADAVARGFVDQLAKGRFLITVNRESAVLYRLTRLLPKFSRRLMLGMVKSARKRRDAGK